MTAGIISGLDREVETEAGALTDSVHRDFDDLSTKLSERGGDVATWQRQIQLLLK